MSNDFSRWAPPDADSTPAPGSEPKTQSATEQPADRAASTGASPVPDRFAPATGQPEGTATGQSGVASSLKPVLGSLVTGATRTTATPRPSASPHEASAPASAPRTGAHPPRRERDPQRLAHKALYRRLLSTKVIIGVVLAVVVLVLALPRFMAYTPSFSGISKGPISVQGYKGSATNTNVLSSDWAAGVSVAWTIPEPRTGIDKPSETTLFADGTTLYMVSRGDKSRSISIASIDVSSSEPTVLWTSNDESMRLAYSGSDFSIVSAWQWIAVENILISKSTGIQTKAPWEDDHPVAMVDDILVTCSGHETCSGWTYSSGSWERLWQSITGIQSRNASVAEWDGTRTIGTGEEASVLVPVDNDRNPQIVNAHTGVVSTLGKEGRLDDYNHPVLYPASDGILVDKDSTTYEKFDTSGKSLGTVKRRLMHIIPAEDGRMPTLSEWEAFYESGRTPWTTGMLEATGDGCESLTVHTTGGIAKYSAEGMAGVSASTRPPCTFSPAHARASADGTAAFVQKIGYKEQTVYFFDMANNKAYTSAELTAAQNLTWVYDDLLVGLTDEGLIAFTPTSS
ncbi:Uncharacterised protein [Mycobacteroides abscessus subsp. abscessus]|nr:Uncharacterised protein [Mycobacteroides abscessus subsp. abscessus]